MIRQKILRDTGTKLDNDLWSTSAEVAGFRPAGLLNNVTGIAASTATDLVDKINEDILALKLALINANCYDNPVILINEGNKEKISHAMAADGTRPFAAEVSAGNLGGVPFMSSTNVVATEHRIVDQAALAAAVAAPTVETSDTATLVEVDDDGTDPTMSANYPRSPDSGQVGDAARDTTNNPPIRSLFQTESVAVKNVQYISWKKLRPVCVERITGVSY